MANWRNEIDLTRVWSDATNNEAMIPEVCKDVIAGLRALRCLDEGQDYEREELISVFSDIIDNELGYDEFNDAHAALYDLCDQSCSYGGKIAWVKTF